MSNLPDIYCDNRGGNSAWAPDNNPKDIYEGMSDEQIKIEEAAAYWFDLCGWLIEKDGIRNDMEELVFEGTIEESKAYVLKCYLERY